MQKKQVQKIVLVVSLLGFFSLKALSSGFSENKETMGEFQKETLEETDCKDSQQNAAFEQEDEWCQEDENFLDQVAFEVRNDIHDAREATFADTVWIGVLFMKYYLFTLPVDKIFEYSKWTVKYLNFTKDLNEDSSQQKNS